MPDIPFFFQFSLEVWFPKIFRCGKYKYPFYRVHENSSCYQSLVSYDACICRYFRPSFSSAVQLNLAS
jgi:hypothetical protein